MTTLAQKTQEAAHRASEECTLYTPHWAGFVKGAEWERDRDKWIKVEDQLPETDGEHLVVEDENYGVMWFDVKKSKWGIKEKNELPFFFNEPFKVTHWQPLPQLPKV